MTEVRSRFKPPGLDKYEIAELIEKMGIRLGFCVEREVHTGVSKVDVVWFDNTIKPDLFKRPKKLETTLLIPIVGFEIEEKSAVRKIIRGDVDSLNSLYPLLGVLVLSARIHWKHLERQLEVVRTSKKWKDETVHTQFKEAKRGAQKRWETDLNFVRRVAWTNPYRRVVVMTDNEIEQMADRLGVTLSSV